MTQGQPVGTPQLSLSDLYEQHWLHIRHIENERLSLASLYAFLVGGGVIFVFSQNLSRLLELWLLSFLLLVTLVFGTISWRLSRRLAEYRTNVDDVIAKPAGLGSYLVKRRGGERIRTGNLLTFLYLAAFVGLGLLLLFSVLNISVLSFKAPAP